MVTTATTVTLERREQLLLGGITTGMATMVLSTSLLARQTVKSLQTLQSLELQTTYKHSSHCGS